MAGQKTPSPEMPAVEEFERFKKEAGAERQEEGAEAIKPEAKDAGALREKIEGKLPKTNSEEEGASSDEEIIKQRMEVIIDRSLQQVIVAGFNDAEIKKVLKNAKRYINTYPHILKEVYVRILKERDERISGKIN